MILFIPFASLVITIHSIMTLFCITQLLNFISLKYSLYDVFPVLSDPITRLEYDFSGCYEINQYTAHVRASSLTTHHILILGALC